MSGWKKIIVWLVVVAVVALGVYGGYAYWQMRQGVIAQMAQAQAGRPQGPLPLPVGQAIVRDVTDYIELTGTTQATEKVVVTARVTGYLEQIHFTDGALVEKDQLLFSIEPDAYRARRDEAAARLQAGRAEVQSARQDLDRVVRAVETNAVSKRELTRSQAAYETAQAAVLGFQAALDNAELDLNYTQIKSPIAGRIGRRQVDTGNLVGPNANTVLTTVRRIEPLYVYFHISEHLLKGDFLARLQGRDDAQPLPFFVGLPNQDGYPYEGTINYVDNTVDSSTGTVYVRGRIPNEDQSLLSGMFVRLRVPISERPQAVLVPEQVIGTDLGGKYLLVLDDDNVLRRRNIELGATIDGLRVVLEGLDGSETFIVSGFHMARPGVPVEPIDPQQQNSNQ